jgi:hypothetical protein
MVLWTASVATFAVQASLCAAPATITDQANQVGWGPSSYYSPSGSPWWTVNSDWNNPPAGTQWIDYNTSTFPNGTTIHWNYGPNIAPGNVWGYPEVSYGTNDTWDLNNTHPANWGEQIGTLGHFNMDFNYSLSNSGPFDVLAETFLNGHETGIVLSAYPGFIAWANSTGPQYHFDLGGLQGEAIPNAWGPGTLMFIPDSVENGTPMTQGSIDFAPILQWAISQGWLSSSDELKGFEFGVEAQQGAGSLTINNLNYDWGPVLKQLSASRGACYGCAAKHRGGSGGRHR